MAERCNAEEQRKNDGCCERRIVVVVFEPRHGVADTCELVENELAVDEQINDVNDRRELNCCGM